MLKSALYSAPYRTLLPLFVVGALVTLFGGVDARAANVAWGGTGTNGNWTTSGNFAALGNDTLQFQGTGNLINTNDYAVGTAGSTNVAIQFLAGSGAFQLFGNKQFLSSGVLVSSTNTQTINLDIGFTAANTWTTTSGNLIMNGSLSGAFSLTKTGPFDLFLNSATNSYGGATIVSGGRLVVGTLANAGTVSSIGTNASITLQTGGDLDYTGSTVSIDRTISLASGDGAVGVSNTTTALTISGVVSGAGNLQKLGAGTLILSGANTYTGATTISNGTLAFSGSGRLSTNTISLVNSGAVLDLSSASATSFTNASLTGAAGSSLLFSNKNLTLGTANTSTTFSGTLSGNASSTLTKVGTGTLTLAGDNNFSGGILISAGALAGTTANLGGMPLTNNATLIFDQSTNGAYSTVLSGTGALGKLGAGTVTLDAANTYAGATTITVGALRAANNSALGTNSAGTTVASGAALELDGGITIGAESLSLSGTGISTGGALRNIGGSNSYGGVITLNAASRINSDAGTLTIDSAGNITGNFGLVFGGSGNIVLNDGFNPVTTTQTLGKDGTGTLTLGAASTYTGLTTISAGTLAYGVNNALSTGGITISNTLALLEAGVATLDIGSFSDSVGAITLVDGNIVGTTGVLTSTVTYALQSGYVSASLAGAVGVNKTTANTVVLAGSNSFSGVITNAAGVLRVANNAALGTTAGNTIISNGAALELTNNVSVGAEGLTLNGTGIANAGALRSIGGSNTYAGLISLASASRINSDADTLFITNTGAIGGAGFALSIGGAGNVVLASVISNTIGGLIKDGAGTLTLTAASVYTGATTISEGTVLLTNAGALSSSSALNIAGSGAVLDITGASASSITNASLAGVSGATLSFAGKNLTVGGANTSTTFSGTLSGNASSTLTKVGTGTLTLAGENNFSGGILISAGGLAATTANLGGMPLTNNATLIFDQSTNGAFSTVLSGTGALGKLGSGTVTLGDANTYGGTTTIGGGAFSVGTLANAGTASSIGTNATLIITNGGVLDYTGSSVSVNRGISLASGVGGLSVSSGTAALTISGVISNTGSLLKGGAGTLVLAGANTYTGGTTISAGTLALTNAGSIVTTNAISLASGTVLDVSGITAAGFAFTNANLLSAAEGSSIVFGAKNLALTNTTTVNLGSSLSGSGGLTKGGAGTLVMAVDNTGFTGGITVAAGVLDVENTAAFGTGSAGTTVTSGATLAVSGNITNTTEAITVGGAGVGAAGALRNLSGENTLSGGATLTAATTVGSDAGTLTLGNINAANFALTFSNIGNAVVSGSITNSTAGLTKNGSGTLTLAGSNSYAGVTDILLGTVRLENANALGTTAGNTTLDTAATGAALYLAGNINVGENLSFRGTGISGEGALYNAEGTNTWNGAIVLANTATIGAATNSQLIISGRLTNGTRILTMGGDGNITLSGGLVSAGGDLIKAGAGTLVLAGSNTFANNALLAGNGVVSLQSSNSLGGSAANVISNGATLDLTGGVDVAAATVTINGTGFNSTGVIRNSSGTNIYRGAVTLGSASTIVSESGSLTLGSTLGGSFEKTFDGAGNTTVSGIVSGTAVGVTKNGTGTLTLTAANNYTGATIISNGAVNVRNATGLGTTAAGTTVVSGAALELQGGITVGAEALTLSGVGINGGGALRNIIGFNTYGGTITNLSAARINSDVNTLTLSGGINATNQLLTFGGTGDITVTGIISNSTAGVTKDGSGVLTLSGLNTYTGTTTVSAGTLAYGTNNVISAGAVNVNGGTLSVGAFSDTVGAVTLTSGNITGSTGVLTASSYTVEGGTVSAILGGSGVTLTKNGAGTVTLSGANTYTGATSINGGTLAIGSATALTNSSGINLGDSAALQYTGATGALNRNITVTNGTGTIRNTGAGTLTLSGNLSKNGTVLRFNNGAFNITGVISGASANSDLIVDNATVTLSNANTYNGPTYIRNAGVLNANVAGALPTNTRTDVVMDDAGSGGSTLSLGANQVIASLAGAGSSLVTLGANTLTIGAASGSTNFAGVISGTGRLVKDGASTQILSGSNTFSGPLTISAGTLQIGNGTDAGSIAAVSSISNNGVLAYQIGSGTRTLTAPISGSGSLSLNSPGGILNVNGTNSYSGGTTIIAGELHAGTSSSVGTGAVTLAGTNASFLAQLHYSNTATPLSVGALSLNGNARLDLQSGTSMTSTGIVSIAGTNNAIFIAGNTWGVGTNTLVSGTSLSFGGGANIYLGGSSVNNSQVAIGATLTNGRTSYNFNTNNTSFFVVVNGVSYNVVWSGAANNQWNTNSDNWQQSTMGTNPSGTNIAFVNADDVYFGNAATSGAITVASGIAAANMFVTNSTGTVAFNGAQFSAFALTKSGAGNLTVSNALVLVGTDIGVTNGTLLNTGSGNVTLAGNFAQGSLVQAGSGTVTLSASNSFVGGVVASNGVVSATANNALGAGDLEVSGATVDVGATTQSLDQITLNSGAINGSGSIATTGGVQAVDGAISAALAGSGGMTKTGVGTVTLSGANTYTGSTALNGGTLQVGASANLGNATNGISFQGGTLQTTGSFTTGRDVTMTGAGVVLADTNTALQIDGTVAGGGALTKSGAGTLTLTGNNASFSGGTSLDGGTLRLGSATAAGTGALVQGAGSKLLIDTTGTIANSMTLRDVSFLQSATLSGSLTLDTATFAADSGITGTLSGVVGGSGSLTKTGTGTLVLDNANTYAGGILISDGALKVLKAGALSSGNITNNGILEIAVPTSVATNGLNISNTISGTGSLVRTGVTGQGISLTGTEDNTYTGLTIVNSGTLRFDKSGGAQAVGGNVEVNGGALIITGNEQIPDDKTLTITGGTFDFSPNAAPGRSETLATLTKSGGTLRTYGNNLIVTNLSISGGGTNWINANADGSSASITVRSGGTGLVMSGNDSPTITIGTGGSGTTNRLILQNGVTANVTNGTAQIVSASISGSSTDVDGVVDLDGGTRTFNVANGSAATDMLVSASIGNGGLIKTGDGRLTLSGSNSYAGGTTLSAGQLRLGNATAAGTGTITQSSGFSLLEIDTAGTVANAMSIYNITTLQNVTLSGAKTLNNTTYDVTNNVTATETGQLSGGGALTKTGAGTLSLGTLNTYSGGTLLNAGTLLVANAGAAGSGAITQSNGSSKLVIDTTGTVANAMSIYNITTLQTVTMTGDKTLNNATFDVAANTTYTESGQLSGSGGLDKIGAGTMILAGSTNNTYIGATVVEAGALVLSNSAGNAINNSSGITVDAGASLILGASNQIGDGIGLTLNGGTFIVGTADAGYSETLGTLTLSASSTIDLGSYSTGLRQLTFANSSGITWATNAVLTITNWQGINRQSSDVAEILFGTGGLTSTQLGQIYFANQDIEGGMLIGGGGELVPVPEARVVWGAAAIVLVIGYRERRRLLAILRQVRQGKIG